MRALQGIIDLIMIWRQSGSTTIMIEGAKSQPCILLVSSEEYGEKIRKTYKLEKKHFKVVSYSNISYEIQNIDGRKLPMVIDNSFLLKFAQEADSEIRKLDFDLITAQKECLRLESEVFLYQNGEKVRMLKYNLDRLSHRCNLQEYQNSMLVKKYEIEHKRLTDQPYFLVPLTLFLSFYFLMAIYLIFYFLSI